MCYAVSLCCARSDINDVHVVTWTGKRAQSVSPCQQSSPTCSYTCTSAHTAHNARHLAHNCEGGRLGYAPKSLSGHNPCLRSLSQEGRISKQLGWKGQGLASQFAPSPHLRGVSALCSSKEGKIGSHLPNSPQEEHLQASNARACRAPLAPPASCHSRPGHITELSMLRHILRIFCASKEHFCNYILICNRAAFL